jgi:hypothetical protein
MAWAGGAHMHPWQAAAAPALEQREHKISTALSLVPSWLLSLDALAESRGSLAGEQTLQTFAANIVE